MLDDSVMDKKSVPRTSQATNKTSSLETKFKQDGATKFSRGVRRSDNASQRQEAPRKPNPRKNKATNDKRPKPRGFVNFDRDRSEVVEGDLLEAGAVIKPGKKVNLNHLLNFTFAKRENGVDTGSSQIWSYGKKKLPKYNKEQFLQANCQFVVKEGGNYTVNLADPDILVDWKLVEQVLLPCHEVPSCPICLYPATAAKITRCGHIYCWVCILHYLTLSERSWHKCPICYEAIHKKDLKSVVSLSRSAPKTGDWITLSLMRREKGSLFSIPVSNWTNCPSDHFNLGGDPSITCFQKLLIATKEDVLHILDQEHKELQGQLSDSDNSEEVFFETAFKLLEERHQPIQDDTDQNLPPINNDNIAKEFETTKDSENQNLCSGLTEKTLETDLEDHITEDFHEDLVDDLDLERDLANNNNTDQAAAKSFYFYQASDGQHIYLNSLNVRMLVEEYGSLETCPPVLNAKVVELDNVTMSKILRNRLRYLQHLPLTCQFQIVELYFEPPLVSPDTLQKFSAEVEKRRRSRTRKIREERRRERHIEVEENKKIGKFPGAKYSLNSFQHFPAYTSVSTDEDPSLIEETNSLQSTLSPDSLPDIQSDETEHDNNSTSFAQMLRQGKARTKAIVHPVEAPNPNPFFKTTSTTPSDPINSDEESAPAPEYHLSFGDAIEEAINSMSIKSEKNSGNEKKGKKKKNKNTVLFTTSMNRSK